MEMLQEENNVSINKPNHRKKILTAGLIVLFIIIVAVAVICIGLMKNNIGSRSLSSKHSLKH